jgi:cyanate permease
MALFDKSRLSQKKYRFLRMSSSGVDVNIVSNEKIIICCASCFIEGCSVKERASSYRWVMVAITWLMMFSLGFSWFVVTPMAGKLGVSYAQFGFLVALVPLALVILCIPGGLFADRFGVRRAVLVGGLVMGVFGLLRAFASSFPVLAATMFLCGVGYAIAYPNMSKVTGVWFPCSQYALASGIMFTGMEVGMASSFILTPAVLLPFTGSPSGVFISVGIVALAMTAVWILLAREKPAGSQGDMGRSSIDQRVSFGESLSVVLRNKQMWMIMITCLFLLAPQIGLFGFLQTILTQKGMDLTTAGLVSSMITLSMIPGSFITPMISDRVHVRKPFIWGISLAAAVALYFTGTTMGVPLWISAIVYGFLIGSMAPIILAMPVELMGASYSATAGGLTLVGGYIGAMIAPWLAGYLSTSTGSFTPAVIMCTGFTVFTAVCGLLLKETGS